MIIRVGERKAHAVRAFEFARYSEHCGEKEQFHGVKAFRRMQRDIAGRDRVILPGKADVPLEGYDGAVRAEA